MRINVIHPKYLSDQHLIAEYREMKMIAYYYVKSAAKAGGIDATKTVSNYTLGKGHAFMWYDKLQYIKERFERICAEMRDRGFACNFDELNWTGIPEKAFGEFFPTKEDIKVSLDRVLERLKKQPEWYKFRGQPVGDWNKFYTQLFEEGALAEYIL